MQVTHGSSYSSDHLPTFVDFKPHAPYYPQRPTPCFRFETLCLRELEAEQLVASAWISSAGNPLSEFLQSLDSVQSRLLQWHHSKFSSLPNKIKSA